MLDLNTITLDQTKAAEGKWFTFFGDAELKLASSDHPRYKGFLAKLAKEHRVELDDANPEQFSTVTSITCQALARFVLLDWKKVAISGKEVPYSIDLGIDALKSSPKLYEFVIEKSGLLSHFSVEDVEEAKKS